MPRKFSRNLSPAKIKENKVEALYLGNNQITDVRAASIIEVLQQSSYHVFLIGQNPNNNQITDEDAVAGRRKVYLAF